MNPFILTTPGMDCNQINGIHPGVYGKFSGPTSATIITRKVDSGLFLTTSIIVWSGKFTMNSRETTKMKPLKDHRSDGTGIVPQLY